MAIMNILILSGRGSPLYIRMDVSFEADIAAIITRFKLLKKNIISTITQFCKLDFKYIFPGCS